MSRLTKLLIGAASCIVLLLCAVVLFFVSKAPVSSIDARVFFALHNRDSVKDFSIYLKDKIFYGKTNRVDMEKRGDYGKWRVVYPFSWVASRFRVLETLNHFSRMLHKGKILSDKMRVKDYGFDDPFAIIKIGYDVRAPREARKRHDIEDQEKGIKSPHIPLFKASTLIIGHVKTTDQYFLRLEGYSVIPGADKFWYAVPKSFIGAISQSLENYRDRKIFQWSPKDFHHVRIMLPDEAVVHHFSQDENGQWFYEGKPELQSPEKHREIRTMLQSILGLYARYFIDGVSYEDLESYGFMSFSPSAPLEENFQGKVSEGMLRIGLSHNDGGFHIIDVKKEEVSGSGETDLSFIYHHRGPVIDLGEETLYKASAGAMLKRIRAEITP